MMRFHRKERKEHKGRAGTQAGFTLIEIMVALTLLGIAAAVLLEAHYGALNLFVDARNAVQMDSFVESAIGQAELAVASGTLTGTGTFGKRFPDFSFSYAASPAGQDETVPLYQVTVTVTGPDDTRTMMMMVYSLGIVM